VDLTPGANGAKCGCRRFWSRFAAGRAYTEALGTDQSVWCMCSHHACYHDDAHLSPQVGEIAGQENEKPKVSREPLSPVVQDLSFRMPSAVQPSMDFTSLNAAMSFSVDKDVEDITTRLAEQASPRPDGSLPDTLSWGEFLNSQPGVPTTLPPIPPQCLMPSQPSSTTSSSQARYLRPFAGRGLQTLSGVAASRNRALLKDVAMDPGSSIVHVPSVPALAHGSPAATVRGARISDTPRPQSKAASDRLALVPLSSPSREPLQHLTDAVQGHEQRLDRLENVSFSAPEHDECNEKHDQVDLRITELEVRVDEVEKFMNDTSSHGTARQLVRRDAFEESTSSAISVSSHATARAPDSVEMQSQIQSLQSEITQLRSLLPSVNNPWEVEVVFLPFPLKRSWLEMNEFKADDTIAADEWTQLPNTNSSSTLRAQSPSFGEWADFDHDYEWLLPKACRAQSVTDRRLRSRGLVQTISVKGADARSVQIAMSLAFGDLLREINPSPASFARQRADTRFSHFLGLQQPWVPLRKIHKDSRLRFLTPAEMITPAVWDVNFLNSVVMRSCEPRLFVTHPQAYLQNFYAYENGWTWQRIRELRRVYPDSQPSQEVPEADALEEYWAWHDPLDEPPSMQTSLSLRQTRTRVSVSPSQQYFTSTQFPHRASSPMIMRGKSPLKERRSPKPLYIRTTSLPPSAPPPFSPSQSRRRVVSYGQDRKLSPHIRSSSSVLAAALKRRRTRSPSRPRNTPHWSTASPSPLPPGVPGDERNGVARGTTPFFYATPYSNAPYMETRPSNGGVEGRFVADDASDEASEGEDNHAMPDQGESTDAYNDDESVVSMEILTHPARGPDNESQHSQQWQLPEDEPWPGIEDQDRMSDGENVDPLSNPVDGQSDASSQPSEYPSTQQAWRLPASDGGAGFHIHEDDDGMRTQSH
jgi:hypothetical protein